MEEDVTVDARYPRLGFGANTRSGAERVISCAGGGKRGRTHVWMHVSLEKILFCDRAMLFLHTALYFTVVEAIFRFCCVVRGLMYVPVSDVREGFTETGVFFHKNGCLL